MCTLMVYKNLLVENIKIITEKLIELQNLSEYFR